MKGHTISVMDLYKQAQTNPNLPMSQLIQNATFSYIFNKEYGSKVTKADVTKQYDEQKAQYGGAAAFSSQLQQAGYTTATYKKSVKLQLLQKAAVDAVVAKTQYTKANLDAAWKTYHPQVYAVVLSEASTDAANKAIDSMKKDSATFLKDAKAKNLDIKFDSSSTNVPQEVMDAAFKLKDNTPSAPITVQNQQTGATNYYVVYMIKNQDKGSDMTKYDKQLKAAINTEKENDTTFTNKVIKDELAKNNVIVKDRNFANVFSSFGESATTGS